MKIWSDIYSSKILWRIFNKVNELSTSQLTFILFKCVYLFCVFIYEMENWYLNFALHCKYRRYVLHNIA